MKNLRIYGKIACVVPLVFGLGACGAPDPEPIEPTPGLTAFTSARLIVGNGDTIESGTIGVRDGRIETIGSTENVTVPEDASTIDLSGRTVTPG